MIVRARSADGSWDDWRVGRRRLAFLPGALDPGALGMADGVVGLVFMGLALTVAAVVWLACLAATAVVWPWRKATGNWLVVAYTTTGGPAADKLWRETVRGKAEANALIERWVKEIREHGSPQDIHGQSVSA
jgi:hypothetical protein